MVPCAISSGLTQKTLKGKSVYTFENLFNKVNIL